MPRIKQNETKSNSNMPHSLLRNAATAPTTVAIEPSPSTDHVIMVSICERHKSTIFMLIGFWPSIS